MLYSSSLGRTATVMGKRSYVDNLRYCNACSMHGTNSRFATIAGTLNICLYLAETEVESYLSTILSCHLSGIGSVLLGATETHLTRRRPRNNLTFAVSKRHNDIVKRAVDVKLPHSIDFHVSLLSCNCFLCHNYLLFSSFLLVSNSLLATLARTCIILSALAAYGESVTVTYTAVATDVHQTLDVELDF